jgi:GTP-dependent phosphoenolpyruvate carboxykinase
MPGYHDLPWEGLDYPEKRFSALMYEDSATLAEQVHSNDEFFNHLGKKFPAELKAEEAKTLAQLA